MIKWWHLTGVLALGVGSLLWYELTQPKMDADFPTFWEDKVSVEFRRKVYWIAAQLGTHPNYLMTVMAFETKVSFRADILNEAGSGAVGLLQFLRSTARTLGTSTAALAGMTPEQQLSYVYRYLSPYAGRVSSLEELYTAVYKPAALGLPLSAVLQFAPTEAYILNRGLDANRDGRITKAELAAAVVSLYRREAVRYQRKG